MKSTQHQEADLVSAIRDLIGTMGRSTSSDLWDSEDIAIYTRIARKTVQNSLVKKQGFPTPLVLPGGKRWVAKEVKEWLLRHR